jgi:hypothetical protein
MKYTTKNKGKNELQLFDLVDSLHDEKINSSSIDEKNKVDFFIASLLVSPFQQLAAELGSKMDWKFIKKNSKKKKTSEMGNCDLRMGKDAPPIKMANTHVGVYGDFDTAKKGLTELMNRVNTSDKTINLKQGYGIMSSLPKEKFIGYITKDNTSMLVLSKFKTNRSYKESLISMVDLKSVDKIYNV